MVGEIRLGRCGARPSRKVAQLTPAIRMVGLLVGTSELEGMRAESVRGWEGGRV